MALADERHFGRAAQRCFVSQPLSERLPRGPNADPLMEVDIVGRAVLQMANLPLEANLQFMTIMATKMPFVGRG